MRKGKIRASQAFKGNDLFLLTVSLMVNNSIRIIDKGTRRPDSLVKKERVRKMTKGKIFSLR